MMLHTYIGKRQRAFGNATNALDDETERQLSASYEAILAGTVPVTLSDAYLLHFVVGLDLEIMGAIAAGQRPPVCRVCACSEHDPCFDGFQGCAWVEGETDICTSCVDDVGEAA